MILYLVSKEIALCFCLDAIFKDNLPKLYL